MPQYRQMSNARDTHLSSFSALVSFFPEALSSATTSFDTAASRFSEILGGRRVNTCWSQANYETSQKLKIDQQTESTNYAT